MKMHILKIKLDYYIDVISGAKKAELRKDDRDFKVGDLVHFVDTDGDEFTNGTTNINLFQITHILKDVPEYGLDKDYVILSIKQLN